MADKDYILFASTYDSIENAAADLAALKEIKRWRDPRSDSRSRHEGRQGSDQGSFESTHAGKVAGGVGSSAERSSVRCSRQPAWRSSVVWSSTRPWVAWYWAPSAISPAGFRVQT